MREMQAGIDLFVAARESFVISVHFRSADGEHRRFEAAAAERSAIHARLIISERSPRTLMHRHVIISR